MHPLAHSRINHIEAYEALHTLHVIRVTCTGALRIFYCVNTRYLHIAIACMHLWHGAHITVIARVSFANCSRCARLEFPATNL